MKPVVKAKSKVSPMAGKKMNDAMSDAWDGGLFSTKSGNKARKASRVDAEKVSKDPKVIAQRKAYMAKKPLAKKGK